MNWFIRIGLWWDRRRVLRAPDLDAIQENYTKQAAATVELFKRLKKEIDDLKTAQQIPQAIAKEFTAIKIRLDRLELTVGLKREPTPLEVPGAARIG